MPRTPLARRLKELFSVAAEATARHLPAEQIISERNERRLARREFLADAITAAAATTGATVLAKPPALARTNAPRIVIVGAGLAGLTCAYRLKQAGFTATVYEAASRAGGRCRTQRGFFNDNQFVEQGGEFIDTDHYEIRQLVRELGLQLDDQLQAVKPGTQDFYYFDNGYYPQAQVTRDLQLLLPKVYSDLQAAGPVTNYNTYTARGLELDHQSVADWISASVPGGLSSKLGQLLEVTYTTEYALDSNQQSALNLIYLLGYADPFQPSLTGSSDERYRVHGGNDQIVTRLQQKLSGQLTFGYELVSIRRESDGTYTLIFNAGTGTRTVRADKVVLALPFSILRSSVDFSDAGFQPLKEIAITEQGMGQSTKLHLQFTSRYWETLGCDGGTFADTGYQNTWDESLGQAGASGIMVDFTGGSTSLNFASCAPPASPLPCAQQFLNQIEPVLPGLRNRWNGKASLDYWPGNKWTKGSYSVYKIGQYTRFAGIESQREANCFFAGEHTSYDYQGYLNGAVSSGNAAASAIMADQSAALTKLLTPFAARV